jgi:hypothetical protein
MNEIRVIRADGRELVQWELEVLLTDLLERAQARLVATCEVIAAQAIRRVIAKARGGADAF